jgi:hypothetical protein
MEPPTIAGEPLTILIAIAVRLYRDSRARRSMRRGSLCDLCLCSVIHSGRSASLGSRAHNYSWDKWKLGSLILRCDRPGVGCPSASPC